MILELMLGEAYKVHLPGESPWAECVTIHDDGSWDGKICNRLFHEMSEAEQATWLGDQWKALGEKRLPKLHDYRQGQVVTFVPDEEMPHVWVPAKRQAARH